MCRSRRDDQNAYIECPIWNLDEEVMPPGRLAPRSDRLDRFSGGTGWRTGQISPNSPIRVRSYILTRDMYGLRLLLGTDLPVLYI